MAFVSAAAPVSDRDSREYHVGGPQRYIRDRSIQFYSDDITLTFYQGQSMLNLWFMVLGSDSAAQVLSWWFAVALVLSIYSLAKACVRAGHWHYGCSDRGDVPTGRRPEYPAESGHGVDNDVFSARLSRT